MKNILTAFLTSILIIFGHHVQGIHYYGDIVSHFNGDGKSVMLKTWGNEYHNITETQDGYTTVFDYTLEQHCYAELSLDRKRLVSTGLSILDRAPDYLNKNIRSEEDITFLQNGTVPSENEGVAVSNDIQQTALVSLQGGVTWEAVPKVGEDIKGLVIPVCFTGTNFGVSKQQIDDFFNKDNNSHRTNNGSIAQYLREVSGDPNDGKQLNITWTICDFLDMKMTKSTAASTMNYMTFIKTVLNKVVATEIDISVFANNDSQLDYIHIIHAGGALSGCVASGYCANFEGAYLYNDYPRWEYNGYHTAFVSVCQEQVPSLDTMGLQVHEILHSTGYIDHSYWSPATTNGYGSGMFDRLGYRNATHNPLMNNRDPCEPSAFQKYFADRRSKYYNTDRSKSWLTIEEFVDLKNCEAVAGNNYVYKFTNPARASEYFLVENRTSPTHDSTVDSRDTELGNFGNGIAIWHVDEDSPLPWKPPTRGSASNDHYSCSLVQADNRYDFENAANGGDYTDLWSGATGTHHSGFNDFAPYPKRRLGSLTQYGATSDWWGGTKSGLRIFDISSPGKTMTFSVITNYTADLLHFDYGTSAVGVGTLSEFFSTPASERLHVKNGNVRVQNYNSSSRPEDEKGFIQIGAPSQTSMTPTIVSETETGVGLVFKARPADPYQEALNGFWFQMEDGAGSFSDGGNFFTLYNGNNYHCLTIDHDGQVKIAGASRPGGFSTYHINDESGAYLSSGGTWTNNSTRRAKRNIVAAESLAAWDLLDELTPVDYEYRRQEHRWRLTDGREVASLEGIAPEMVDPADRDGYVVWTEEGSGERRRGFLAENLPDSLRSGANAVAAIDIAAHNTAALKEAKKRIVSLDGRLSAVDGKQQSIRDRLEAQEIALATLQIDLSEDVQSVEKRLLSSSEELDAIRSDKIEHWEEVPFEEAWEEALEFETRLI